jgi:hypothetical protein
MSVKHELAGWIETEVIAEHILGELEELGVQPTLENAKTVWLDVLENELCQAIHSSVKARFDVLKREDAQLVKCRYCDTEFPKRGDGLQKCPGCGAELIC